MRRERLLFSGLLFAACAAFSSASAQDYSAKWLRDLTEQLEIDKDCEVEFYIRAKEYGADQSGHVEARAKCKDGREFDAFRESPLEDFTLIECGHAVCENKATDKEEEPA